RRLEAEAPGDGQPLSLRPPLRVPRAPSEPRRLPSPGCAPGRQEAPPRPANRCGNTPVTEPDAADLLDEVYSQRFADADAARKDAVWQVLCAHLQRYVPDDGVVLDLACDRGDFVRHIRARERWAADLRDVSRFLPHGVRFVQSDGLELAAHVPSDYFDL